MGYTQEDAGKPTSIKEDMGSILKGAGVNTSTDIGKWTHDAIHEIVNARDREIRDGKNPGEYTDNVKDGIFAECKRDPEKRKAWEKASVECYKITDYVKSLDVLVGDEPKHVEIAFKKSEEFSELVKHMSDIAERG
ncbi:MAG: hypothetical protein ABIG39_05665 [Candidatus Micrarchaeota archaeon]